MAKKRAKSEEPKKTVKSEEPKKKKPISLNILEIAKRLQKLEETGGGGSADSAKRSDIATEFSTETSYTAGCFVYYDGKLYQFNADHSAGAWDPTDVVEANVTDQIVSNASAIAGLTASDVAYDNTGSGLTATDVKGAIDELAPIGTTALNTENSLTVPANTSYNATSVTLSPGKYIIMGTYSGYNTEANYFKMMTIYNSTGGSSVAVDRRSDGSSGGGSISVVVNLQIQSKIELQLRHTHSTSLNVNYATISATKVK